MIKAYWWNAKRNFGDQLTPLILQYFGYQPVEATPAQAEVVVCGSILHHVPSSYRGAIVGSGFILPGALHPFPHANVLAVRGPFSLRRLQLRSKALMADPGLLASHMYERSSSPEYAVGIVPHYVDALTPYPGALRDKFGKSALVIDVSAPPEVVIRQISNCEVILSSSLHGIVVADSYSIPNAWTVMSNDILGHGYKFYDYNAAFNVRQQPTFIAGDERPSEILASAVRKDIDIKHVQDSLITIFRRLDASPA